MVTEEPARDAGASRLAALRRFGLRHLGSIGVFVVVALVFCSFQLLRARTDEVPLQVAGMSSAPAGTSSFSARSTGVQPSPTPAPLVVHVVGRVGRPGIVRLPAGARVADAVQAAGGVAKDAQLRDLNLAEPLVDGSQVIIGPHGEESSQVRGPGAGGAAGGGAGGSGGAAGGGGGASAAQLDLNTATVEQFEALPGIGPVTAQSIVAWRTQHQRFSSVEELQEVDGIGPKTYQKLAPLVRV